MDITGREAGDLLAMLERREISAQELMRATLERIAASNGALNAIVDLRDEEVLMQEARAADDAPMRGALHGLPMAVKDLANVGGLPTSQGSPLFAGQVAQADDLHVARMRAAGAIFIGKTNTPEFGLGSHTFNPVHGVTRNPYNAARSCGGSSGGAAVALAAGMLSLADGSDMMGSLRNPAGWCNVYGMRPSWSLVPSEPRADTFLHQLSTNGPMARSPRDMARLLAVMAGPDPRQPHGMPVPDLSDIRPEAKGARIGWLGDWGGDWPFEAGILDLSEEALRVFEGLGARVEPVKPPFSRVALWQSWVTLRHWAVSANLSPLLESGRLKPEAIWEVEEGQRLSALKVHKASVIRSGWFAAAARLFETYDALVLPTAQVWPFPADWTYPKEINGQQMDTYHRWMEVVVPASLAGLPAVAVPAGFGAGGLPMGIQLIGRRGDDARLLELAQAYHEATLWPTKRPPVLS
ncbi:Acylamidase [Roseovarius gaetbuli]|uniref:Acylamidase n=1 Tax=Roseovarius gaetbuli TaxID=1356575 RepID=A0A1X7A8S4_9RHOB|nr:amidase [Roseovarius gaetbuli]SLN73396.1 Acylamidase [Roseovarius gaetbuli]